LGLRELGIAAEFGLSSLAVPKRLLKGKRNAKGPNAAYGSLPFISFILTRLYCRHSAKSAEPPPPYPPPQPFVPLTAEAVKSQIGLLRGYFEHRIAGLDTLPDDPQNPAQAKLGPLGQVIWPSSAAIAAASGGGSKKKAKPKGGAAAAAALAPGLVAGPSTGVIMAGKTVAGASVGVIFTAIHAGAVAALFWTLLGNAPVATQIVEDGTPFSLIVRLFPDRCPFVHTNRHVLALLYFHATLHGRRHLRFPRRCSYHYEHIKAG
jgi:hypothetical protein